MPLGYFNSRDNNLTIEVRRKCGMYVHLDVDLVQPCQRMNCGPFDSAPVFLYLMIDWSLVLYGDEWRDHPVR